MIGIIVNILLIVVIIIDINFMIRKKKNENKLIKIYEDNTRAIKEFKITIEQYMKLSECEDNEFNIELIKSTRELI